MRSLDRMAMNCLTFSRATSSLFCGWKSSASMELEMSNAMTMLMPSVVDCSARPAERGRASAMINPMRTRFRAITSARAIARPARGPLARMPTRENTIAAGLRRRRHTHHAGMNSRSTNTHGEPNSRCGKLMDCNVLS